jgi:hypothetical protein
MKKSQEKAKLAKQAIHSFASQFGPPDIYNRIVLEVLFEELCSQEKVVSVSRSAGQKRHKNSSNLSRSR